MKPFSSFVIEWHEFYSLLGSTAGTLTGLLFVALSLNIETLNREEYAQFRYLAQQTFANFIFLMLLSLCFLIPHATPNRLSICLTVLSTFIVFITLGYWRTQRSLPIANDLHRQIARTPAMSLIAYFVMLLAAVNVSRGQDQSLYLVVGVVLLMLATAARNAWVLLMFLYDESMKNPNRGQ